MVLINGAEGIGTGWSTNIPPHKVEDVVDMMKNKIKGGESGINIGWENYRGTIERQENGSFLTKGDFEL